MSMIRKFDFIVVGSGSAGSVLAGRLSERPENSVLLLEAGRRDKHPLLAMPAAFYALLKDPALSWGFQSEPEPYADNRVFPLQRGKVIGGTGAVNGMTYSRGDRRDYDEWNRSGCTGWAFEDVLPYFKKAENNWRGETPWHGGSGPLSVVRNETGHDPFYPAMTSAARALNASFNADICGESCEGFAQVEFTITKKGRRSSSAQAYLHPALGRTNLAVESEARVTRILMDGMKAIGVEYVQAGALHKVYANREVILSGGAYNSPQLLMLSGIGNAEELERHGIAPIHDLYGVGQNLQDHGVIALNYQASGPFSFHRELRADRVVMSALKWQFLGTGPFSRLPLTCWAFRKTLPTLDKADIQFFFSPVALNAQVWFPGWRKGTGHIVTARNAMRYPKSRGVVSLRSADPLAAPKVLNNFLSEQEDVHTLMRAVEQTRELFSQQALAALVNAELAPGKAVTSPVELEKFVRANARPSCHPSGTCAMGVGLDAVVDPQLRVHGIEGLRVVDASVMPSIVGGNLNAPIIMIAEKAADMILNNAQPQPVLAGRLPVEAV